MVNLPLGCGTAVLVLVVLNVGHGHHFLDYHHRTVHSVSQGTLESVSQVYIAIPSHRFCSSVIDWHETNRYSARDAECTETNFLGMISH